MNHRKLYRWAASMCEEHGRRPFLDRVIDAMHEIRDLPRSTNARQTILDDPEIATLLSQDDALGQIYQAINAPSLEQAYRATARDRRKFTSAEIPAVTQLFTPRWVVEFLIRNTLGRVERSRQPVKEIRMLDPACGTMNFGLVAIEMLEAMYLEEMDKAGRRDWPAEPSVTSAEQIACAIATNNLVGIDIDPTALDLAAATIRLKLRQRVDLQLWRADALFSPAIERKCRGAFDVVVTNPPYLAARNLPPDVVQQMKRKYPRARRDAYTCFIERCLEFARPDIGRAGLLTMHSFMFTGAFENLRRHIFDSAAIETIAHFGPGLFDVGNPGTLQTAATVLRRESDAKRRDAQAIRAIRLTDVEDKREVLATTEPITIAQSDLSTSPRAAWTYWLSAPLRNVFATFPRLADIAPPRQGLATTDNARFVRYWWEVQPTTRDAPCRATSGKWFPYAKGGRFRRWYESARHRVDWLDDGAAIKQSIVDRYPYLNGQWQWVAKNTSFYGREGVTYSYLTSGKFSARRLEGGCIFDVAGSSLFPQDPLTMLAVLNSSVARELLAAINPTVNFQVGDLAQLPVPRGGTDSLRADVTRAIEVQRELDAFDETSPDFLQPAPWGTSLSGLDQIEHRIDRQVADLYGIDGHCEIGPSPCLSPGYGGEELARRWVSYALRQVLGERDGMVQIRPVNALDDLVQMKLKFLVGSIASREIDAAVGGIGTFLAGRFFPWHVRLHHRRPVVWMLGDADRAFCAARSRHARPNRISRLASGRLGSIHR